MFGIVGALAAVAANRPQETDYITRLTTECLEQIEKVLSVSPLFTFVRMEELRVIGSHHDENSKRSIKELCEKNGLNGAMTVLFTYSFVGGFKKPVALRMDWTLLTSDGREYVRIRTVVPSDRGVEVFPDTRDPKYRHIFTELARKNAEDFLLMLSGKKPKHGRSITTGLGA